MRHDVARGPALAPPTARHRRRRGDRSAVGAATAGSAPATPTRSPSACAPATRTSDPPCCGPGSPSRTARRSAATSRRHVGARRRRVVHVDRRRGEVDGAGRRGAQRPRRRRRRRPVVVPLPIRRVDEPDRAGRPDRHRSGAAPPGHGGCQHFETGFYAAHADLAAWAPDLVVFLGDFIYEYGGQNLGGEVVRSHGSGETFTRRRVPPALRPVPRRPAAAGRAGGVPVADDLGRPRGGEQLRRVDVRGRRPAADEFLARRLAAYQAWWEHMPVRIPRPTGNADTIIYRTVRWGRSPT